MHELDDWLRHFDPELFPYDSVIGAFHRVGKHFVDKELLADLAQARSTLPEDGTAQGAGRVLAAFLDTALDKWDGRYDYRTYLSLGVLPLPDGQEPAAIEPAGHQRDLLVAQLIADALRQELAAAEGDTDLFPEMRPPADLTAKRLRLGVRAVTPAMRRLGLPVADPAEGPEEAARQLWRQAAAAALPEELQTLRLSILPVYVSHDEYMFLRILQAFEVSFALLSVLLRQAVAELAGAGAARCAWLVGQADEALREAASLFPLLATMQVGSFRTFRLYTEGASAIQSRNYKMVESLCRVPDGPRLDSAAYLAVPEVREQVLTGRAGLAETLRAAQADGLITAPDRERLDEALAAFSATLLQWRQTHYRMAVRMLGEGRTGTGYTEGTPYLSSVRDIPVFEIPDADDDRAATPSESEASS
ncbi:tryptophan 2,3-dioxygenase [Kitasatospora kifunensis]|uniref:Tryptophan 2,3-dioxygenase n=1 Tax=Kitasatospora kifunensis TaxID=58351 RepID=A0A7W7VTL3_KITKI|nr:tryptophan 2,3-dioxygenase [Kitasatospora kifunensis]MBB4922426.1 tryptophan 2,3-dioxygenase [Kitasatospora kifunensis]